MTQASPCVVTTITDHEYSTGDFVRISNMGLAGNFDFGMEGIEDKRYKIIVISPTTFSLHDPITGANIDTSNRSAYVSSGKVNKIRTFYTVS